MGILSENLAQKTLKSLWNHIDEKFTIWEGDTTKTQLVNEDGSKPYCKQLNDQEKGALFSFYAAQVTGNMGLTGVQETVDVFRLHLITETPPDRDNTHWVSYDGGATFLSIGVISKQRRWGFWEVFFVRN